MVRCNSSPHRCRKRIGKKPVSSAVMFATQWVIATANDNFMKVQISDIPVISGSKGILIVSRIFKY